MSSSGARNRQIAVLIVKRTWWELARHAYEGGDPDSGDSYALLATDALDRYHECLLHDSLAPPKEFLDRGP
jgi:hypothetical protein